MLGHSLQASEPEDHASARAPESHEYEAGFRPGFAGEPAGRREMKPLGECGSPCGIHQAVLGVQNPDPEDGIRDDGDDGRKVVYGTIPGHAADLGIQQEGDEQAGDEAEGETEDGEERGVE